LGWSKCPARRNSFYKRHKNYYTTIKLTKAIQPTNKLRLISALREEKYKQAWREYAGDSPHFEQYDGDMLQKREAGRSLALSRINELLKFAETKY